MDKKNEALLVSTRDAAEMLDVSERTVSRLITAGELPVIQMGRIKRIEVDQIHEFINRKRMYNKPRVELGSISQMGERVCNFTEKGTAFGMSHSNRKADRLDALLKRKAS